MLYREPKLLKVNVMDWAIPLLTLVSVLYREPKLLKDSMHTHHHPKPSVSVLYREPKLLKGMAWPGSAWYQRRFSALP